MNFNEQAIIESIKSGDREAQRLLYKIYADRLITIAFRYVNRREVAEDISHDAFIKIFRSISKFQYRGEGSLRAWMERITINTALEWLRSTKRLDFVSIDSEQLEMTIVAEPSYEDVERLPSEQLMRFVHELPDGYRAVFNMFCVEKYSHREIATKLNINEKSSSSQLLRARKLLASRINEYMKNNG